MLLESLFLELFLLYDGEVDAIYFFLHGNGEHQMLR